MDKPTEIETTILTRFVRFAVNQVDETVLTIQQPLFKQLYKVCIKNINASNHSKENKVFLRKITLIVCAKLGSDTAYQELTEAIISDIKKQKGRMEI